jgi:hypothetical protein
LSKPRPIVRSRYTTLSRISSAIRQNEAKIFNYFKTADRSPPHPENARKWRSDPAYRKTASKSVEAAGFGHDTVEAEAFSRAFPAQRRLTASFKQLSERRDKRVATMRDTAKLAIKNAS